MTDRNFGQGSSAARLPLVALVLALTSVAPARAQDAETPTPAPSSIFRLPPASDGRSPGVQGPSDNGLPPVGPNDNRAPTPAPTPTPAPAQTAPAIPPRVTPTQPTTTTTPSPAPAPTRPAAAPAGTSQATSATPDAAPDSPAQGSGDPPPLQTTAPEVVAPPVAVAADADDTPVAATPGAGSSDTPLWAWALALFAALGAGLWYWRRRPALAGQVDEEVLDAPRAAAPLSAPRAATPPAPRPAPAPAAPTPRAASPLVNRAAGERRAVVGMALDIAYIRFEPDHIVVGFSLHLINQGIMPATGLMVRIALNQGSAMPEPVLGRFFDGAGGSVLRDDMTLDAGAGETVSTEVMLPRAAIEPLMIGGKPMLVPVMAFDVTYHWDGEGDAFGQNAGSFVLGREQGSSGSDKLAPLPLDRPNHQVDRPGARATAIKRSQ